MAKLPKKTLTQQIDAVNIEDYPRGHLGASVIGDPCKRKIAYSFYWASKTKIAARLNRIFRLGDDIEEQIIKALNTVGLEVTGQQDKISDRTGHAGGSCDGIITNHPDFDEPILFEAKSANHNNFLEIKRKGVQESKPTHYTQMNMYMGRLGLRFALYAVYNKNNSELHFELIPFDEDCFKDAEITEHDVLFMQHINSFPRISTNPSWYHCKTCDHQNVCQRGERPARNCRTCERSEMHSDGVWYCSFNETNLDRDAQIAGCHHYELGPEWK